MYVYPLLHRPLRRGGPPDIRPFFILRIVAL